MGKGCHKDACKQRFPLHHGDCICGAGSSANLGPLILVDGPCSTGSASLHLHLLGPSDERSSREVKTAKFTH